MVGAFVLRRAALKANSASMARRERERRLVVLMTKWEDEVAEGEVVIRGDDREKERENCSIARRR